MSLDSRVNATTKVVGLMGWPLSHTLSPTLHNTAFTAMKLNWIYLSLPIAPEHVKDAMRSLRAFNFVGSNVTVPHKQAIMRYLDEIDRVAQVIGAVNTVILRDGRFYGYNTDCYGFLQSLLEANFDPAEKRCLILGAGGAARAVVYSLADARAKHIAVYNRTVEKAAFLVEDLKSDFANVSFDFQSLTAKSLQEANNHFDLVVNTTSVGMNPHPDACPWPEEVPLPAGATICDLVYNPLQTQFMQQAEAVGLPTIDGVGMLVHQGAKSFEIWTGQKPPTDLMRQAVLAGLGINFG